MTGAAEAVKAQVRASDPASSAWVMANAGSGKTRVLIDRVARLLLRGADPQGILCLTYTEAAAREMQNRLFARLGRWAMLDDADLRRDLAAIEEAPPDAAGLAAARRLFAQAMEVPGGLRIQTIHAFCASLLRRFPLEAGIAPDFEVLDDLAARRLRAEVADALAAEDPQGCVSAAAAAIGSGRVDDFLDLLASSADALSAPPDAAALARALGLQEGLTAEGLAGSVLGAEGRDRIAAFARLCETGSVRDREAAEGLSRFLGLRADPLQGLALLEGVFLTGAKASQPYSAKLGALPTKATRRRDPALVDGIEPIMRAVEAARPQRLALAALDRNQRLGAFAVAFLARYRARKSAAGALDFGDLIGKARSLLADPAVGPWVLWKLDGGVRHLLVDEAQDTSPGQWEVIEALTSGFAADAPAEQSLFVVGDLKQSIYSFQGADPAGFAGMEQRFGTVFAASALPFEPVRITHSFRSSPAVLRAVDAVFRLPGLTGLGPEPPVHRALRDFLPGRVELWPPVPPVPADSAEGEDWTDPPDRVRPDDPAAVLGRAIARRLRQMVDGETIAVHDPATGTILRRPVTEGDILILVRGRKSTLFSAIIRSLKEAGLRVAGTDRIRIGAELAVRDIASVLRFLALPADDLALAEALRSPIFGWTEQELFALAAPRPKGQSLWQALREAPDAPAGTREILSDLRDSTDFLRPHDLIARLLTRHGARRRLVARLGSEAEEGIDALLAQALAHESSEVPDLTGFLCWLAEADLDLKRPLDSGGDSIRVMTVHGAKGLESPIVVLPDCAQRRGGGGPPPIQMLNGAPVWLGPAETLPPPLAEVRARAVAAAAEEEHRLLYVAMTRAQSHLIVCAAGKIGADLDSWHAMVAGGLASETAEEVETPTGRGRALIHDAPLPGADSGAGALSHPPLAVAELRPPAVRHDYPPAPQPDRPLPPLSPSGLGGAKVLPGDDPHAAEEATGLLGAAARAEGELLHRLLETLPSVAPPARAAAAVRLCAEFARRCGEPRAQAARDTAFRLLADPALAVLFGPDSLTEVGIAGPLAALGGRVCAGSIDRLIVGPDRVLAVDYKSNRLVPDRPEEVPEGILRQMGAYAALLEPLWPGRHVETAVLWTVPGRLMPLPRAGIMAALHRAAPA